MHDGTAFVILDVAHPARLFEGDFLGKSLLLEIPNGVIIGVGEKMLDGGGGLDIILQVGHQMSPVALNLLVRGNGAENDLRELPTVKRPVGDTPCYGQSNDETTFLALPYDLQRLLDNGH